MLFMSSDFEFRNNKLSVGIWRQGGIRLPNVLMIEYITLSYLCPVFVAPGVCSLEVMAKRQIPWPISNVYKYTQAESIMEMPQKEGDREREKKKKHQQTDFGRFTFNEFTPYQCHCREMRNSRQKLTTRVQTNIKKKKKYIYIYTWRHIFSVPQGLTNIHCCSTSRSLLPPTVTKSRFVDMEGNGSKDTFYSSYK